MGRIMTSRPTREGCSMVIQEGDDRLEIDVVDQFQSHSSPNRDVELSVEVSSAGFRGHGFAWISADAIAGFLTQLRELENRRQGSAELRGDSAEEFRLRFWSVNGRGHVAVGGVVTKQVHRGEGSPYPHRVEFGFEFDSTTLPTILSEFRKIQGSTAKT